MAYAENTSVSVARSKAEIEDILSRYGASNFACGSNDDKNQAIIFFRIKTKQNEQLGVRVILPLPDKDDYKTRKRRGWDIDCTQDEQHKLWEQACRSRWRSLFLVVKARLEACDAGISTIEREFMPDIVVPGTGGLTIGDSVLPQLPDIAKGGVPNFALVSEPRLMLTGQVG